MNHKYQLFVGGNSDTKFARAIKSMTSCLLVSFLLVSTLNFSGFSSLLSTAKAQGDVSIVSLTNISPQPNQSGGELTYQLTLSGAISDVTGVSIYYWVNDQGLMVERSLYFDSIVSGEIIELKTNLPIYNANGDWSINTIVINSLNQSYTYVFQADPVNPSEFGFVTGNFTISDSIADTQSPQLMSVGFSHDTVGPNTTVSVTVSAFEEGSGLSYAYLELVRPNGEKIGLGLSPSDAVLQTNFYVGQFELEGDFKVGRVVIYDYAGNNLEYTNIEFYPDDDNHYNFSGVGFTVEGTSPIPLDVAVEEVQIQSGDYLANNNYPIMIRVSPIDQDYVSAVAYFQTPDLKERAISLVYQGNGIFYGEISVKSYDVPGEYKLKYIYFNVGGYAKLSYNIDLYPNENVTFNTSIDSFSIVGTQIDILPPVLETISVQNSEIYVGQVSTLTVYTSDDHSMTRSVRVRYQISNGQNQEFWLLQKSENIHELQVFIHPTYANSQWKLVYVELIDYAGNRVAYVSADAENPNLLPIFDLSNGVFTVLGEVPRPEIATISNYQPIVGQGDQYHVEIKLNNLDDPNAKVSLYYQSILHSFWIHGQFIGDSTYSFSNIEFSWDPNGSYQLQKIVINSDMSYYEIFNSNVFENYSNSYDLSPADFYLLGGIEVADLPIIESFSVTPLGEPGDTITFELVFTEVYANIEQVQLYFSNQYGRQYFIELQRTAMMTYKGTYNIHDYSHQGIYNLNSMTIYYSNSYPHQLSPGDYLPAKSFEISGTLTDDEPPVFISVESITKRVTKNESAIIHLHATDSLSGIEGINVYTGCNGETTEVLFTHVEGDLFVGALDVRSSTPEGLCEIYSLSIYDVAGNIRHVQNIRYYDSGIDLSTGDFEIYDTISTSYVLNYINTVQSTKSVVGNGYLNMTMNFGEPFLDAYNISAVFVDDFGVEKVLNFNKIDDGVYTTYEYFSIYSTPGIYRLQRIYTHADWLEVSIYHDDQPSGYPYFDFSDVYFEIAGTIEDSTPPQLLGSTINRTSGTINQKIEFVINAIDLETEIEYGRIGVEHITSGYTFWMYFSPLMPDYLSAYFYVNAYMPEGDYRVQFIELTDLAWNTSTYYNNHNPYEVDGSVILEHLNFSIQGTLADNSKPVLNSMVFLKNEVSPSETLEVLIDASDEGSGLSHGFVTLKHKTLGHEQDLYLNLVTRGLTLTYGYINEDAALGEYYVKSVKIEDQTGNIADYCNTSVQLACDNFGSIPFNFDQNQLTISPKSELQYIEIFDSVFISQNNLTAGDVVTIRVTLKEEYRWANMLFIHFDSHPDFAYLMPEFVSKGTGIFEANVTIDELRRWDQRYQVQSIQLMSGFKDFYLYNDHYVDAFPDLKYVSNLSQFDMLISQPFVDETSPEFNGIQFSKAQYRHNDYMRISLDTIDLESRIEGMMINFRLNGKAMRQNTFVNGQFLPIEDGQLVYNEFFMSAGMKPGMYEIDYIQINNSFGLRTIVYNQKFYGERVDSRDFESSKFELISEDYDYAKPEFISAQINKREFVSGDKIVITIEASDVGSGLRTGYLYIKNRQSAFTDNRLSEYTYYAELRKISDSLLVAEFDVGPYFAPGNYDIGNIDIYDEAFNRITIKNAYFGIDSGSYDLSDLSFEVKGTQLDQELPELVSLEILTPVVALGDTVSVKVNAFDSKSGLSYIDVVWECGGFGQIVAYGQAPKNPDEPIILRGNVRTSLKACEYKVKYVYLGDRAGNWRVYIAGDVDQPQSGIMNFSQANIQVFGQTESVTVNDVQVSNALPLPLDVIEVNVDILDNIVEPETAYINYRSSINTVRTVDLSLGGIMDYRGLIEIGEFEASAVWEVDSIIFIDRFGEEFAVYNSVHYPNELNVVDMSSAMFTVDNPLGDSQAPEYTGSQLEKGEETTASVYSKRLMSFASAQSLSTTTSDNLVFGPNDLISYTIDATDDISGVDRMEITYDILGKFITFNVALTELNGKYVGNARVMNYHPGGLWLVHKFVLIDKAGNRYEKSRSSSELNNLLGFAHLQLQVANTTEDKDAPVISDVSVNLPLVQVGDIVQFICSASDANGIKDFNIVLQAKTFGVERVIAMNPLDDGRYLGSFEITENTLGDVWEVKEIILEDFAGNKGVITQLTQDLSSLTFTVKALAEITIEKLPDQLVYDLNDPFSLQGLVIVAKYNDGTSETIDPSQLMVHGFDSTIENLNLDVYLQYKNKLTKLTVKVMDVAMVSMEITASPNKLTYTQGESLDLSGLIVWGYYNSSETEQINITLDHVVNPQVTSSAPGNHQVFIQYEGFEVFYYIEVVAPVEQNKTPVTIVKTDTMMVITTPVGKVKVILFGNNRSKNLDVE